MKFISLSSGSSGNCYYIGDEDVSVVIDAGISARSLKKSLSEYKINIESIDLILVSHDHADHVKHLASFAHKFNKPVVGTQKLFSALERNPYMRRDVRWTKHIIEKEIVFKYKNMEIIAFDVPHDSSDNVGFFISLKDHCFTFATDVGVVTNRLLDYCRISDHLIIESNYDEQMLSESLYPDYLVRRIRGGKGHLSNRQTSDALRLIVNKRLKNVFLCHLSDNNNTPEAAFRTSSEALNSSGEGFEINLFCLPRKNHMCYTL